MPQATKGLDRVIEYLELNWSKKELRQLDLDIQTLLTRIKKNHKIGFATHFKKNIRKSYPNKYTYLIYMVKFEGDVLEIIDFGSTREKPSIL